MLKKVLAVVLSALIITAVLPFGVFAAGNGNEASQDYFKEYYYDADNARHSRFIDADGSEVVFENDLLFCMSNEIIPSAYDSRDYGRVTSVKNQNPLGSCWAFAFCAAAESSLIAQGFETKDSVDLSESHLLWFRSANYVEGSDIPVQQDKYERIFNTFDDGGNSFEAISTVARWSGFAKEEDFPYIRSTDTSGMQYDASDMFVSDYNLVSATLLDSNNNDDIKKSIMDYGAVAAQMYYTNDALRYTEDGGCNHYQKKQTGVNHGIAIVGWDDNYDKSNFKTTPVDNGAWLVKNSWGPDTNDEGFFWLSYYDKSICDFMEIVAKPAGDYDNNYQYDGITCTAAISNMQSAYGANIFTANGYETVKGCGMFTFSSTSNEITVSLYTGLDNESNPTSGTLRESQTFVSNREGYYTIDFDGEYKVSPGEKFSIVVKYYNYSGVAMIPYESRTSLEYSYGTQAGQSFYLLSGGKWTDVASTTNRGNIPIKAFTVNDDSVKAVSAKIKTLPKTDYFTGDEADFSALEAEVTYSNGTKAVVGCDALDISGFDTSDAGVKTVTAEYLGFIMNFEITVTAVAPKAIEISRMPDRTEYFEGDAFDSTGLEIRAAMNNGTYETVDKGFTVKADLSKPGTAVAEVTYKGFKAEFKVRVLPIEIVSLKVEKMPSKLNYTDEDAELDVSGLVLSAEYSNGSVKAVKDGFECTGFSNTSSGKKDITVSYGGLKTVFSINVKVKEISSIEVEKLPKTDYFVGDKPELDGISVKVNYDNGTSEIISKGFEVSEVNLETAGIRTVVVEYLDFTAEFDIEITEVVPVSASIVSLPSKLNYTVGDAALDTNGLWLEIRYNNGDVKTVSDGFTCTGFDSASAGTKSISVKYGKFTLSYDVTVEPKPAEQDKYIIRPAVGSNTAINYEEKVIFGLDFGIKSLDKYIRLADGYSYSCSVYGSGGDVKIIKNRKVVDVYKIIIFGDMNGDGWCDKNDLNIANNIYYRRVSTNSVLRSQLMASDINHDGYLDYKDTNVMERAAALIKQFDKRKTLDWLKRYSSAYNDYVKLIPQYVKVESDKPQQQTTCGQQSHTTWNACCGWFWACWYPCYYRFF